MELLYLLLKKEQIEAAFVFKEPTFSTFGSGQILQAFHPSPLGKKRTKVLFIKRLPCIVAG